MDVRVVETHDLDRWALQLVLAVLQMDPAIRLELPDQLPRTSPNAPRRSMAPAANEVEKWIEWAGGVQVVGPEDEPGGVPAANGSRSRLSVSRNSAAIMIGPIAKPKTIVFTDDLPKTRSGKIMRRLLKDIASGAAEVGEAWPFATLPRAARTGPRLGPHRAG